MKRWIGVASLALLVMGCHQTRVFEIDFNQAPALEWDGKVQVTKTLHRQFGPLLTLQSEWTVDRIEFASRDGRTASIDPAGYRDVPLATLEVATSGNVQILGTRGYWGGSTPLVVVADPECGQAVAERLQVTATQPATQPRTENIAIRSVPEQWRPYAQHAEQISLADWWAIGLQQADNVTVEFQLAKEQLRIVMRGDPRKYGPGVLEVWTSDGRLLKRFERKPIAVSEIERASARRK